MIKINIDEDKSIDIETDGKIQTILAELTLVTGHILNEINKKAPDGIDVYDAFIKGLEFAREL